MRPARSHHYLHRCYFTALQKRIAAVKVGVSRGRPTVQVCQAVPTQLTSEAPRTTKHDDRTQFISPDGVRSPPNHLEVAVRASSHTPTHTAVDAQTTRLLWPIRDVAAALGCSAWQVYALCNSGALESKYLGRRRLVTDESLRAYVAGLPSERTDD
jgi:hypothetical protein